jgi:hypothetical protein
MSIDEATDKINAAPKGSAHEVALECIAALSEDDRDMAGGDLEEMAILIDGE